MRVMRYFSIITLLIFAGLAFALNPVNSPTNAEIDDIANQIRGKSGWQILDARTQKNASGNFLFRFKLLSKKGMVKVIFVDPRNPDLRELK